MVVYEIVPFVEHRRFYQPQQ